jgi:hypothetical protein
MEIKFSNGKKKKVSFEYDDPNVLPKWNAEIKVFGFQVFSPSNGIGGISTRLGGIYRFNSNFFVLGMIMFPYLKEDLSGSNCRATSKPSNSQPRQK